jgi:ankyrin repeat protein
MVPEAVERPPPDLLQQSASRLLHPTPITDRLKVFRTAASMPNALATLHDDTAIAQWFLLVRRGSYKTVQKSLREGWAPVNATDKAGYTACMHCCVSGRLLEALLGCKEVNINIQANDGNTALHLAASNGHLDCCSLLVECNAHVNARCDADGFRPWVQPQQRPTRRKLLQCDNRHVAALANNPAGHNAVHLSGQRLGGVLTPEDLPF